MSIPYGIIASCFNDSTVVPFLGAAASTVGAPPEVALPGGNLFASRLAQMSNYPGQETDALSKIAQYLEEIPADRGFLLNQVYSTFFQCIPSTYQSATIDFFQSIPISRIPKLIVTTNYDILIERLLEQREVPYISISHIMRGNQYAGRFLYYTSLSSSLSEQNILPKKKLEENLAEMDYEKLPYVIIYKIHGTANLQAAQNSFDSIVLTESDYIDFLARDFIASIPSKILNTLRTARLLFLGYSLNDWNLRVLLRRIQQLQQTKDQGSRRHWACLLYSDEVEERFWERRGVNFYRESLDIFLFELKDKIENNKK